MNKFELKVERSTMEHLFAMWGAVEANNLHQEDNFCKLKSVEGGMYILNLKGDFHHRLPPTTIHLIDELLDQVLKDKHACALITTNEGKFFSNGMDINYLRKCNKQRAYEYVADFQRLASKFLTFCIPTIAVIRGHAVGAGCMLALAHDYRLMISARGSIFMNEVDLGLPLTPGNMALLRSKLPLPTFQAAVLTGKRYNGEAAVAAGIVHATHSMESTLLQEAIRKAMEYKSRNWKREVYRSLKMEMFKNTVKELEHGGTGFARM